MSVIVVDTETSAFAHHPKSSIIEVGVVVVQNNEIVANYSSLIKPLYALGDWSEKSLEITGLDKDDLMNARSSSEVWSDLVVWLRDYKPLEVVLAWNVTFDKRAFSTTFTHTNVLPWGECLMRQASQFKRGNRKGYALKDAARDFDITFKSDQHRALEDARVAAEIYKCISIH